ncbi:MAG: hypothetical protein KTV68_14695 [Acidimicrobiia bacterium]|nr:hypothetical protein [Acidimicrobiia bacterium]
MRRITLGALVVLLVGTGLLLVPPSHETAGAETGVAVTDKCAPDADSLRFNVLFLLDASLSLRRTDPGNARRDGLEAVVNSLASLERTWSYLNETPQFNFEINVAVDTFATRYTRHHGWQGAGVAQLDLIGKYGDITALPTGDETTLTDYRQALRGASQRFNQVPSRGCSLLLWFTDGEHATQSPSTEVSLAEWGELRDLCRSDAMRLVSDRGAWTQAVLLSSGSPSEDPLRLLFGDLLGDCPNALEGEISQLNAEGLESELHELIAEAVRDVVCRQQTPDLLPGEEHACPSENPQPCTDDNSIPGNGTAESPCEYHFTLHPNVESFRLSLDMTFLNRGIRNPDGVNMRLQAPSGRQSNPIFYAEDNSAGYQAVVPFWFLSRRLYESRWEIIGHQAAEQLARETDWEWAGVWKMLFWGDNSDTAQDASKAAAAIKVITTDSPSADLSLNDEGHLVGFIQNFPLEYQSVELRLRMDDGAGAPVYPTRPYLACQHSPCDPVSVSSEMGYRLEVPSIKDEVLRWDTDEAGGDGARLTAAIEADGSVEAVAVLEQEFLYGGAEGFGPNGERGQPLLWRRDIGNIELDLREFLTDQPAVEDAKRRWELLKEAVGETSSLPSELELTGPDRVAESKMEFGVAASPGLFSGVITLGGLGAQIEGHAVEGSADDQRWSCSIPGTWDQGGSGQGDEGEVDCPDSLEIDLVLTEDAVVDVQMDFDIALVDGLEEGLWASVTHEGDFLSWAPPENDWAALWNSINESASETVGATVDVDLPTTGDKLRNFLPILIALVVLALLLRVSSAWRLRPWPPLATPEYLIMPLDGDPVGYPASIAGSGRELCMALTRRSTSAQIGGLHLFSLWRPLLLGGPPRLAAKSFNGQCLGPQGSISNRKGEQVGLIGSGLDGGWALESSPVGDSLIVWDLPAEDFEAQVRLDEAQQAASHLFEKRREILSEGTTSGSTDSQIAGKPDSPNGRRSDPLAAGESELDSDPFATDDSERGGDSRYIDPFDQ